MSHFSTSCAQKAEVVIALGASIMKMRRDSETRMQENGVKVGLLLGKLMGVGSVQR